MFAFSHSSQVCSSKPEYLCDKESLGACTLDFFQALTRSSVDFKRPSGTKTEFELFEASVDHV